MIHLVLQHWVEHIAVTREGHGIVIYHGSLRPAAAVYPPESATPAASCGSCSRQRSGFVCFCPLSSSSYGGYQCSSCDRFFSNSASGCFCPQQQLGYHQPQHFHSQQQQQQLQAFWANQMQEIEQTTDFKNHSLPLARIKKIMKADEDVRMISAEAPVVFAKACEMFILELTLRSWIHTEENKRRTLQKNDIAAAISRTDVFDFLVDIIPRDELKEEGLGITKAAIPLVGSPDALPYYYVPPQPPVAAAGMMMGKPADQAALYASQQPRPPLPFMPWPQSHTQTPSQQPPPQQQQSDS
ncbi:UNVERIFIED_CONTAM: Nuclear transcription factor Y subunit C-2 [Sesamum latifolium]|uniref:Nuclear transcription factor Y subunit C-2 n=1 Tax=Sesamum latifolium TaxID=2727402 RepID=A0AAW2TQE8_9LAMI